MSRKKGEIMSDEQKNDTLNNERKAVSAAQFRGAARISFKEIETPEFGDGCFVRMRSMSARHAHLFLDPDTSAAHRAEILPGLIAQCLVNEDGTRLLTDEDAEAVRDTNLGLFMRLTNGLFEVSGIAAAKEDANTPKAN